MAFKIDPNTVYSLKEIEAGLKVAKTPTLRKWIKEKSYQPKKWGERGWYLVWI